MTKYCTEFPEIISQILLKAHRKSCNEDFAKLSDFVQKSSFHGIYHVRNHQFRLKMMFSKGRRTNLKLKSTNFKLEIRIFRGTLMFLVSICSIWVSNSSDDRMKFDYLATQRTHFQNTTNCLLRNNLGGYFRFFNCEIQFKPLRYPPYYYDGDNISSDAQKNKMNSRFFSITKLGGPNLKPQIRTVLCQETSPKCVIRSAISQ